MCSQSKGIGSADMSASTFDKLRTNVAWRHCASHRRITHELSRRAKNPRNPTRNIPRQLQRHVGAGGPQASGVCSSRTMTASR